MDIDDFLDRELGGSISGRERTSRQKLASLKSASKDLKTQSDAGTLPELNSAPELTGISIPFNEQLQSYNELWQQVKSQGFSWNEQIVGSVVSVGNDMRKQFAALLKEVQTNQTLVKRAIAESSRLLQAKQYDQAMIAYEQGKSAFDAINDYFVEEKKELFTDLFTLYHQIKLEMDSQALKKSKEMIIHVHTLIKRGFAYLSRKDLVSAKDAYSRALEKYSELPDLHVGQKIKIGEFLLSLYKDVSIHYQIAMLKGKLAHSSEYIQHAKDSSPAKKKTEVVPSNRQLNRSMEDKPYLESQHHKHIHNQHLIKKMVTRKMKRANEHIRKGFLVEAQKDLEAVLKLDSQHPEANRLMKKHIHKK